MIMPSGSDSDVVLVDSGPGPRVRLPGWSAGMPPGRRGRRSTGMEVSDARHRAMYGAMSDGSRSGSRTRSSSRSGSRSRSGSKSKSKSRSLRSSSGSGSRSLGSGSSRSGATSRSRSLSTTRSRSRSRALSGSPDLLGSDAYRTGGDTDIDDFMVSDDEPLTGEAADAYHRFLDTAAHTTGKPIPQEARFRFRDPTAYDSDTTKRLHRQRMGLPSPSPPPSVDAGAAGPSTAFEGGRLAAAADLAARRHQERLARRRVTDAARRARKRAEKNGGAPGASRPPGPPPPPPAAMQRRARKRSARRAPARARSRR